jgi:hypothetical protein
MRQHVKPLPAALVCAAMLAAGPALAGKVSVQFENPARYTDIGPQRDADAVQQRLRAILETLAAKQLPASQTLHLVITDVDLAGEIAPTTRLLHDVRVMGRHPDWPRITLHYTLEDGGRQLAQGSEVVSDMAYLMRSTHASGQQGLPYEQRMLSDWFDSRFGKPAAH